MAETVNVAALARGHAPAAIRTLVELMRASKNSATRLKAARALRGRMDLVRQVLPLEATEISSEVASALGSAKKKPRGGRG